MRINPSFSCLMILILMASGALHGWGAKGHAATGILAMKLTDDTARRKLDDILGSTSNKRIGELCNWPDTMEDSAELKGLKPQHYVNIPRSADRYDADRDCRGGLCLTEAIKKYAGQLGNEELPRIRRVQAFAWLCHLVGDLHQPLHCGFADDRGGNTIEIEFNDETMNLHQFWDTKLIASRARTTSSLIRQMKGEPAVLKSNHWNPDEVNAWTLESHNLAREKAYPASPVVDAEFASQSWALIGERMPLGAERLALILNATLGNGEVVLDR